MKASLELLDVHESDVELGRPRSQLEVLGLGVKLKLKLKLGTILELVVGRSYGWKRRFQVAVQPSPVQCHFSKHIFCIKTLFCAGSSVFSQTRYRAHLIR